MSQQDAPRTAFAPTRRSAPAQPAWFAAIRRRVPALLPLLPFLVLVLLPPLNHDVAAVLQFSQRWVAGAHLYSNLIDVNPPLIFVLNLAPAWIAAHTGLDAVPVLQACLLGFGALCWRLAWLARDRGAEGPVERMLLDILPGLVLLDAGYDFGQREHLMAVAALPYLLAASRRAAGEAPRGRLAIALVAGICFALKPHFLGIPALVEAWLLVRRGWRAEWHDPVPWIMAAVWATYLASLPLIFPDYLARVLPMVWDDYLQNGGESMLGVLLLSRMATALVLLGALLWPAFRADARRPLPVLLAMAAIGALAAAVVQHKGWSYHILPIELFGCGLGCLLAARWIDALQPRRPVNPAAVAGVLAALFGLYAIANGEAPWKQINYAQDDVGMLTRLLRQKTLPGQRVLVLSPGIWPIFPALNYAHLTLDMRTMNIWPLQGAYHACPANGARYHAPADMDAAERATFDNVAADFARDRPELLVVDRQPGIIWCGSEFDFLAYFLRNPVFAQAFAQYRPAGEWTRYRFFRLGN